MNPPKVTDLDDINFLVAAQTAYSCLEAERVQPHPANPPAHDAYTRFLHRFEPSPEHLWQEASPFVSFHQGILVVDDSTLDKFHARQIELVSRQGSGNHGRVVSGIN